MALNKEFERYNTKIGIPASVVLETIFSTDNKDVETLSRWALKHGFVDLIEKKDGKYYQLQDDYTKQSFYTYLNKEERKQYDYENYLIDESEKKDKVINDLLKRISDLEFEVERLEKVVKVKDEGFKVSTEDLCEESAKIEKAIEYMNEVLECNYHGANITFDVLVHNTNNILKGADKE